MTIVNLHKRLDYKTRESIVLRVAEEMGMKANKATNNGYTNIYLKNNSSTLSVVLYSDPSKHIAFYKLGQVSRDDFRCKLLNGIKKYYLQKRREVSY